MFSLSKRIAVLAASAALVSAVPAVASAAMPAQTNAIGHCWNKPTLPDWCQGPGV
jgi:hypothetical protein